MVDNVAAWLMDTAPASEAKALAQGTGGGRHQAGSVGRDSGGQKALWRPRRGGERRAWRQWFSRKNGCGVWTVWTTQQSKI